MCVIRSYKESSVPRCGMKPYCRVCSFGIICHWMRQTSILDALRHMPLVRRVIRLHLSGQKALESANGAKVRKTFRVTTTLRERSLGAETVRGLGLQTAGSPECVAGTDARGLTAAVRCTLRGTPHTHTRAELDSTERGSKEH
ncbi:hypothetical protein EVAR_71956_1 [Eumeta japonica]|uniref:Uncharacterized protein n=1 Tax=Eumeta variegata TaxID=151549 RepID=A0A4C1SUI3_EUMVA|nr:hypothetical protein EVAR_71956_1 [Eumeta japonica]